MEGGSPLATWIDDAARRIEALSEWSQRSIHANRSSASNDCGIVASSMPYCDFMNRASKSSRMPSMGFQLVSAQSATG